MTLLISPELFSILFKCGVRMNFISHMSFSKIFQIIFIVGSTFPFFIPECLNNSWWCFASSFSTFEDRRRVSLKSCSILFKIRDSSLLPSSHNCFDHENSFLPSGAIQESSQFYPESINSGLFIISFQLSFSNLTSASFK